MNSTPSLDNYEVKYEVRYGLLNPILYYWLIFSSIVFLSVCKPPGFYKKIISWIMNLQINIRGNSYRAYNLLIVWVLFLAIILASTFII